MKALQDKLSDLLNQNWILWDTGARNGELMPCRVSRTSLVAFFFFFSLELFVRTGSGDVPGQVRNNQGCRTTHQ